MTATLDIGHIDYNIVEEDFDRTDWTQFDFDGDGTNEALNHKANYPHPLDLTIDFTDVRRITGSASGTGTTADGDDDAFLTSRTSRWQEPLNSPSHDTNVTSKPTDAQLDGYAFTVDGAQLLIDEDIDLTLSGSFGRRHHRSG